MKDRRKERIIAPETDPSEENILNIRTGRKFFLGRDWQLWTFCACSKLTQRYTHLLLMRPLIMAVLHSLVLQGVRMLGFAKEQYKPTGCESGRRRQLTSPLSPISCYTLIYITGTALSWKVTDPFYKFSLFLRFHSRLCRYLWVSCMESAK